MAEESPIDRIYQELGDAINALGKSGEVSAQVTIEDHARKALLLSVASHFEHKLTDQLKQLCRMTINPLLTEFAVNKAISRQYHTLFSWDKKNANSFFGLFGEKFKNRMKEAVRTEEKLNDAIEAFLELGSLRNQLVHQDYATFPLEKTSEEIYTLYQTALHFVNSFPSCMNEFTMSDDEPGSAVPAAAMSKATPQQQDPADGPNCA